MPVDNAIALCHGNLYETSTARPANAKASLWLVHRAVGGTHQPLATTVEKTVGLVVHFHRDVRTLVQVTIDLARKPDSEAT